MQAEESLLDPDGLYRYYDIWYLTNGKNLAEDLVCLGMERASIENLFYKIFVEEYAAVVRKARWAMFDISSDWYMTPQDTINLLANEPLRAWPKIVKKLEIFDVEYEQNTRKILLKCLQEGDDLEKIRNDLEERARSGGNSQKLERFKEKAFHLIKDLLDQGFPREKIANLLRDWPVNKWFGISQEAIGAEIGNLYNEHIE